MKVAAVSEACPLACRCRSGGPDHVATASCRRASWARRPLPSPDPAPPAGQPAIAAGATGALLAGGLRAALRPPHAPLRPSAAVLPQALRAAALEADPEGRQPPPEWSTPRVGFPDVVLVDGASVPCPLSALAECFNVRCSAHRAAIPQSRRNFEAALVAEVLGPRGPIASASRSAASGEKPPPVAGKHRFGHAGEEEVAKGRLRVTAVGAGLLYQEFRVLSLLRKRGVHVSRLVLIDRLYEPVCSAREPADQAGLRDGIYQELGSWAAIRYAVTQSLQQVTDFLAPDGTEVFVFTERREYEALCAESFGDADGPSKGPADLWRCDLLLQVDAGELKDGMTDQQKASMIRPAGLFCVLWAMTAHTPEEEGLDADEHPLRFSFTRIERRLNDWVGRMRGNDENLGSGKDARMQLVRQWRTYRGETQRQLHEAFLQELERENQEFLEQLRLERPDLSEAQLREVERDLRRR